MFLRVRAPAPGVEARCCCCAFSVWHAARISALKPSKFSEAVPSRGAGSRPGVACGGSLRTVLVLGVAGATDAMLPAPTGPGPIPPADQSRRCSGWTDLGCTVLLWLSYRRGAGWTKEVNAKPSQSLNHYRRFAAPRPRLPPLPARACARCARTHRG